MGSEVSFRDRTMGIHNDPPAQQQTSPQPQAPYASRDMEEFVAGYVLQYALPRNHLSSAFLMVKIATGELCVAKRIFNDGTLLQWELEESQRVITMLTSLQHPNVVAVHHVVYDRTLPHLFVIMPYLPLGCAGKVDGEGLCYPQRCPEMLFVMLQSALAGLSYLHCQGIAHGAIKPENLMLLDVSHVALTDVVMSRLGCRPSSFFTAPELPSAAAPYVPTFEADMYALGVSFYALLCGSVPSGSTSGAGGGHSPAFPRRTPRLLKDALSAMLAVNAKDRLTAEELLLCVEGRSRFPQPADASGAMSSNSSLDNHFSFSSVGSGSQRSRRSVHFV
jgi:serine/threonine protein kinase